MFLEFTGALKAADCECYLYKIQFTLFIQCIHHFFLSDKNLPGLPCCVWFSLSGIWGAQAWEDGSQDAFLLERSYLCQVPVSVGGSVSLGTYWTGYFNYTWMGRFLFQWTDVFLCLLPCLLQAQPGLPEKERCLAWTITFWLWRSSWTSSRAGLF